MTRWMLAAIDRVARWPLLLAWLALIFGLSSIPNEIRRPTGTIPYDKIAHFLEYTVLAFLIAWVLARARRSPVDASVAAIAVGAAVLYGVSDEWHQSYVPGRDPSWTDLSTDALGAVCGAAAAVILSRASRGMADVGR